MFNEGDNVYVLRWGFGARTIHRARVERVTKPQAIITGGAKFNRETGREVGGGGSYSSRRIEHPTPQLHSQWRGELAEVARMRLVDVARRGTPGEIRAAYAAWDSAEQAARAEGDKK